MRATYLFYWLKREIHSLLAQSVVYIYMFICTLLCVPLSICPPHSTCASIHLFLQLKKLWFFYFLKKHKRIKIAYIRFALKDLSQIYPLQIEFDF